MSHYYAPDGTPHHHVQQKTDPTKTRPTRVTDASGKWLPSTTTKMAIMAKPGLEIFKKQEVLKAAAKEWVTRGIPEEVDYDTVKELDAIASAYAESASSFGTQCHDAIHAYLTGRWPLEPFASSVMETVRPVFQWLEENVEDMIHTEAVVTANNFAGTIDLVARIGGKLKILDFKHRSWIPKRKAPVYEEDLWQLCSYMEACRDPRPQSPVRFVPVQSLSTVVVNTVEPCAPTIHEWSPDEIGQGIVVWRLINRLWHLKNRKYQTPE